MKFSDYQVKPTTDLLHLIADSGIQFHTVELELDPEQQLVLPGGRPLRYSFCNIKNEMTGERLFDLLTYNTTVGKYIPVNEILTSRSIEYLADGRARLDEGGVEIMRRDVAATLFTQLDAGDNEKVYTFNSPSAFKTPNPSNVHERVPAFELVLGKWLPMPMFEMQHGVSGDVPYSWCRLRIDRIGQGSEPGKDRYRFTWAFDTGISTDDMAMHRPSFPVEGIDRMEFAVSNKVSSLLTFMAPTGEFTVFSHYIAELLGLDPLNNSYRYIGWYIYLINYIRLCGAAPEVTLHRCPKDREIPVDFVLDIGNSRTCGLTNSPSTCGWCSARLISPTISLSRMRICSAIRRWCVWAKKPRNSYTARWRAMTCGQAPPTIPAPSDTCGITVCSSRNGSSSPRRTTRCTSVRPKTSMFPDFPTSSTPAANISAILSTVWKPPTDTPTTRVRR